MHILEGPMADLATLFDDLVRFQIELWNAIDARLRADCELSLGRFLPMRVIAQTASCRVYDIADELAITIGGASKVVDRIETAGLCRRRAHPDDRRSSILELTPSGRRLLTSATAAFNHELSRRLGSAVSDRSLQQLGSTLAKLRSAGHQLDRTDPDGQE
jgi:DNA-binding MarR family transcriptional regulator